MPRTYDGHLRVRALQLTPSNPAVRSAIHQARHASLLETAGCPDAALAYQRAAGSLRELMGVLGDAFSRLREGRIGYTLSSRERGVELEGRARELGRVGVSVSGAVVGGGGGGGARLRTVTGGLTEGV